MTAALDRDALSALLGRRSPHDIVAAADAERRRRHALRTTVAVIDHLDPHGAHAYCPVTGTAAPDGGFARALEQVSDLTTDLVLLAAAHPSLDALRDLLALLPPRPQAAEGEVLPTVQVGTSDDWMHALEGRDLVEALLEMQARGLQVISDGVHPRVHPVHGPVAAQEWAAFWRAAGAAGLRGHAVVLYGPQHGLEAVFTQLDAIAAVQRETGVFLSVAPCIFDPTGFGGAADAQLTQASLDLRVLAACRLGLDVEHLSMRYERSDLKSAHASLLCGVDDLVGHLFLGARDRKTDAESRDLSVREMERWLVEAGFDARVRNGLFEMLPFDALVLPGSEEPTA